VLWGCTVKEAQARINAREYAEWVAFYRLEPWGTEAMDILFAAFTLRVVSALAKGKSTMDDFLVFFGDEAGKSGGKITDPEAQKRYLAKRFGGI